MADRIRAIYVIESPIDIHKAAALLASEQSIGSFARVVGETDELIDRFGGKVESLDIIEEAVPRGLPTALPGLSDNALCSRAVAEISFPAHNFGPSVSSLFAILLGNLFELQELTGVRLEDVSIPDSLIEAGQGPAFGIAGTRKLADVPEGPIIGTIVKPKLGLSPAQIGRLVETLGLGGIHFLKDDECVTNPPCAPFAERVEAICTALDRVADRTGRKPLYAFNVSDDADLMVRNHDLVAERGGNCVMVSINACGPSAVAQLRRNASLPIHAHRAGWGMLTRHPALGISFTAYQKLWRLTGIDHLHIGGLQSKFFETDDSVIASALACLAPFGNHAPVMPAISSGQWGGQAPDTFAGLQSDDLIYLAGGGILGHPMGVNAGVRAISQAWDAAVRRIPLAHHARDNPELSASIAMFGNLREKRAGRNV